MPFAGQSRRYAEAMADPDLPFRFTVDAREEGVATRFSVRANDASPPRDYRIAQGEPDDYARFFTALAEDFGTRAPLVSQVVVEGPEPPWRALLTDNVHPRILSGYGDPAVIKVDDGWILVATSNDAPDAFPILHSRDLATWAPLGFVFPEGRTPGWAATGRGQSDYWAPEIARVGDEYWCSFTARSRSGELAIGLAKAASPEGPWLDLGRPLLTGSVIDSHIHVDAAGAPWLVWKRDTNSHWPRPLAGLLRAQPALIAAMFDEEADRRTAAFCAAIQPWANTRRPMERYFLMRPLIRAVLSRWRRVQAVLRDEHAAVDIRAAMTTPILIQRIDAAGEYLLGEPVQLLANDRDWEGHLIEGPWLTRQQGRYWLFYAGNDFTSPDYGIGVAVADDLLGPYVKAERPLLQSHAQWHAPGHASVSVGVDGEPRLFFHAYHPETGGYNVFRALLTVGLSFGAEGVRLQP